MSAPHRWIDRPVFVSTAALIALAASLVASPAHPFNLPKLLGGGEEREFNTFKLIHVADLKALMADAKNPVHIYDANVAETREHYGVIPGAKLLASDDNYDLSVLPADKGAKIVFYCANTH
jgi:hypothetical protein